MSSAVLLPTCNYSRDILHLMGHAQIRTTMLYVPIAPQDVWREYARAIENRTGASIPQIS